MNKTIIALLALILTLLICLVFSILMVTDKTEINHNNGISSQVIVGEELKIILNNTEYEYTGNDVIPDFKIVLNDKELNSDSYSVEYENTKAVGYAKMTVTADGYETSADYKIIPRSIQALADYISTSFQTELRWDKTEEAQYYIVYRYDTEGSKWNEIGKTETGKNIFTDEKLNPATEYKYAIVGCVDIEEEQFIGHLSDGFNVITSPEPPSNVEIYVDKSGSYQLSWDFSNGASGYEVYQVDYNGDFELVCDISDNKADIALADISGYNYQIRAYCVLNDKKSYSDYSINAKLVDYDSNKETDDSSQVADSKTDSNTDSLDENDSNIQDSEKNNSKQISVNNIMQYPELPTGCETTALTILLNHMGYGVDKLTIAREHLPKLDFYWENDIYYGADFRTTFAGNPENEYSYGCYAPCIVTAANSYLSSVGAGVSAHNISGTSFDSLLSDYIDNDIPVLIWITSSNLHETSLTSIWTTPSGETVQWVAYEHCVVLTGYDMNNQIIYVSDPLVGNTSYDYSKIRQRYIDMGQQCVWVS